MQRNLTRNAAACASILESTLLPSSINQAGEIAPPILSSTFRRIADNSCDDLEAPPEFCHQGQPRHHQCKGGKLLDILKIKQHVSESLALNFDRQPQRTHFKRRENFPEQ